MLTTGRCSAAGAAPLAPPVRVGEGQLQAGQLLEELLPLHRWQAVDLPLLDQALRLGEDIAGVNELAGSSFAASIWASALVVG